MSNVIDVDLLEVANQFNLMGKVVSITACGSGRINKTFKVVTFDGPKEYNYILQRINTALFTEPDKLMNNIALVTDFAQKYIDQQESKDRALKKFFSVTRPIMSATSQYVYMPTDPEELSFTWLMKKMMEEPMEVLKIIKTKKGSNFYNGKIDAYRIYEFVPNSITYDSCVGHPELFEDCGRIFGEFQSLLRDFDASQLYETLPNFHNTKIRYQKFLNAISMADQKRYRDAKETIKNFAFFGVNCNLNNVLVDQLENGDIPLRVTHNDTKLNNVAFSKQTGKAIAVLDLDTVMPGAVCYDFGDAIRFGCNTEEEESTNFKAIDFNKELFKSYVKGYLSKASGFLTEKEVDSLVDGAMVMTYEVGLRFLTDFLENDVYFGSKYYSNNLNRAKNQLALLTKMAENEKWMRNVVKAEYMACKTAGQTLIEAELQK